jgi:hypothetical protein
LVADAGKHSPPPVCSRRFQRRVRRRPPIIEDVPLCRRQSDTQGSPVEEEMLWGHAPLHPANILMQKPVNMVKRSHWKVLRRAVKRPCTAKISVARDHPMRTVRDTPISEPIPASTESTPCAALAPFTSPPRRRFALAGSRGNSEDKRRCLTAALKLDPHNQPASLALLLDQSRPAS